MGIKIKLATREGSYSIYTESTTSEMGLFDVVSFFTLFSAVDLSGSFCPFSYHNTVSENDMLARKASSLVYILALSAGEISYV